MLDTLILIPHELRGLPIFGWGWALGIWLIVAITIAIVQGRRTGWSAETWSSLPLFLAVAAVIVFLLPRFEEFDADRLPIGLPIRGFGVMVTLGVMSGVGLSAYAARRQGLDPEHIYSLAFWMVAAGGIGARVFYVVQYWHEYQRDTWGETLSEVLNFTRGGLVVYGALVGALGAAAWYLWSRRLPLLAVGDLIAPGMLVGLMWGRIGCFLHGCCFGGLCSVTALGVTFPYPSPPYEHQQAEGVFHGLRLRRDDAAEGWRVVAVEENGPAQRAGVRAGELVRRINGESLAAFAERRVSARLFGPRLELVMEDGREVVWTLTEPPLRSRPVYPVQLYSSVHAALLALLLWMIHPWRRRDGEVFAWMLTLYPVGRFFEEMVRDDEPGRLGTPLTISQLISLGLFVAAIGLWLWLSRRPAERVSLASSSPAVGPAASSSGNVTV